MICSEATRCVCHKYCCYCFFKRLIIIVGIRVNDRDCRHAPGHVWRSKVSFVYSVFSFHLPRVLGIEFVWAGVCGKWLDCPRHLTMSNFSFKCLLFMVGVLCLHVCVRITYMPLPVEAKKKGGCLPLELELKVVVSHRVCWESHLGPLEEQPVFITTEPCLQLNPKVFNSHRRPKLAVFSSLSYRKAGAQTFFF